MGLEPLLIFVMFASGFHLVSQIFQFYMDATHHSGMPPPNTLTSAASPRAFDSTDGTIYLLLTVFVIPLARVPTPHNIKQLLHSSSIFHPCFHSMIVNVSSVSSSSSDVREFPRS